MNPEKHVCTRCGGLIVSPPSEIPSKKIEPYTSSGSTSYVGWIVGIVIAFSFACFVLFFCQNSDSDICILFRDMYR